MGNANRVRRQLANDPRCLHCGANEETTIHILRECKAAREVWRNVGGPAVNPDFRAGNLQEWIGENLKYSSQDIGKKEAWPTFFALTLWWIWKWRNCRVFSRTNEIPFNISGFLIQRFEESWRVLGEDILNGEMNNHMQQQVYIKWKFPPSGWFALNTDAFHAEMKAVETGLDLARRMGIRHLMIQMDSLSGIQVLQSLEPYGGECVHIVHQCRSIIRNTSWEVSFFHCYREGNKAADWLANQGVLQAAKLQMIQVPPLELGRILHEDLVGVAWSRLISS